MVNGEEADESENREIVKEFARLWRSGKKGEGGGKLRGTLCM